MDTDHTGKLPAHAAGGGSSAPGQVYAGTALGEFLARQERISKKPGSILDMSRDYKALTNKQRAERDTRREELERGVRKEIAAGRDHLKELLRDANVGEAERSDYVDRFEEVYDLELGFGVEREMALLEEGHKRAVDDLLKPEAEKVVYADAAAAAESMKSSFEGAEDQAGEPPLTDKAGVLESETSDLEKEMTRIEADWQAPAAAGQQDQIGPGQGQPQTLPVRGGKHPPERSSYVDYIEGGKMVRLKIGKSQFEAFEDNREKWANESVATAPTRDGEFKTHEITGKTGGKRGFTLPEQPISAQEAIAATGKLESEELRSRGRLMRGAHTALSKGEAQDYCKDLLSSVGDSGRDLESVKEILNHYDGNWVVVAVCPGRESAGPLGVGEPTVWCDGNQMAGPTANYDCHVLMGLDHGRKQPLDFLENPENGVATLYFLGLHAVVCEATHEGGYIPQSATRNMAMGVCLVGDGLREVCPLILTADISDGVMGSWKRIRALGESVALQANGESKQRQLHSLIVLLPTLLCGASAVGWEEMNSQTGLSFALTIGPKMRISTASWERRLEINSKEVELLKMFAVDLVALAATAMHSRLSRCALATAAVAERARETFLRVSTVAQCFEEWYARRKAEDVELDMYYQVCGLAWRNQRVLLRAIALLRGMTEQ